MKTVILIRHAQPESQSSSLSDADRKLTAKGVQDSGIVAAKINDTGNSPGLMMTSPTERAIEMAKIFAELFEYPEENIEVKYVLYDSSDGKLFIDLLKAIDNNIQTVMIFGHNPTLTDFASSLTSGFRYSLPKAGVAIISFNTDSWNDVSSGKGLLDLFLTPDH